MPPLRPLLIPGRTSLSLPWARPRPAIPASFKELTSSSVKTWSSYFGSLPQSDHEWRAARNDLVFNLQGLDAVRTKYPGPLYVGYCLRRLLSPGLYQGMWDQYAGVNNEAGYLHTGGFDEAHRNKTDVYSPGTDWSVMNMADPLYLQWQRQVTLSMMHGTEFSFANGYTISDDIFPHVTGPLNVAGLDLVLPFAGDFEGIVGSDEFASIPSGDRIAAYKNLLVEDVRVTQAAIRARFGNSYKLQPNFGHILFAYAADQWTKDVIKACPIICGEVMMRYQNGLCEVPNNISAEAQWAFLDDICGLQKKEFIAGCYIEQPGGGYPHSQAQIDQAKLGITALAMLSAQRGLYARFTLDDPNVTDIKLYEQNEAIRTASALLGHPMGARTIVPDGGAWPDGVLYRRDFRNGRAYLYVQESGGTVMQPSNDNLVGSARPMRADGSLGALTSTVIFNNWGDAAIMISNAPTTYMVGTLSAAVVGTATIPGSSSLTGTMVADGDMSATIDGVTGVFPLLRARGALAGSTTGATTMFGTLTSGIEMHATMSGSTAISASINGWGLMILSSAGGTTTISGQLEAVDLMDAILSGSSDLVGTLEGWGALASTIDGETTFQGSLAGIGFMVLLAGGSSLLTGSLTTEIIVSVDALGLVVPGDVVGRIGDGKAAGKINPGRTRGIKR